MPNINALIGSRICHDLINPLGAISNGIELLQLAGVAQSPEMVLVSESVENATARLKMLRLAFGAAAPDQAVSRHEVLTTLEAVARGGRLSYSWNVEGEPSRLDVRTALLAVMCIETSLPLGGDIEIVRQGNAWRVQARHDRMNLDPVLWAPLSKNTSAENLTPAQVHFALLPEMAKEADRTLTLSHGIDWVKILF